MELQDKVAIVTGAGGDGCGRAVARRLASKGVAVVVSDIDETGAQKTVRLIRREDQGRAAFLGADVAVEAEVEKLFQFAADTYGGVDVVVNNASAPDAPGPLEGWFETLHVDLLGAMYSTLRAVEALRRRGGGAVVNVGSTSALGHGREHAPWPAYDVAKAGVIRLTTALGWLQEENIRVNCIVPGWIETPPVHAYWSSLAPDERERQGVPDVLLTLEEIADAIERLATDEGLGGRVLLLRNGEPARLIADGDPGYSALDDR